MRVVVIADTHVRDAGARDLSGAAWQELSRAEVILHAGDVVEGGLLARLRDLAPVHAVLGNNDRALAGVLPETWASTLGGVRIAMIHDSGPRAGREGRMRRRFPAADLVVFGHSHVPWNAEGLDGQRLLNPGSPTERRGQPHKTLGVLDLEDGRCRAQIVVVD